jgi:hypothetical protein
MLKAVHAQTMGDDGRFVKGCECFAKATAMAKIACRAGDMWQSGRAQIACAVQK